MVCIRVSGFADGELSHFAKHALDVKISRSSYQLSLPYSVTFNRSLPRAGIPRIVTVLRFEMLFGALKEKFSEVPISRGEAA